METFSIKLGQPQFYSSAEAWGTGERANKALKKGIANRQFCWYPRMGTNLVMVLSVFLFLGLLEVGLQFSRLCFSLRSAVSTNISK